MFLIHTNVVAAVGNATIRLNISHSYPIAILWHTAILMPVVFVGAYVGSRWGLEKLRTRSVALIFIVVLFIAATKLVFDLL